MIFGKSTELIDCQTLLISNFHYHIFSRKDVRWVSLVLRHNKRTTGSERFDLESDYGFKLIIPHRDFEAGTNMVTNIENGMRQSRRIIFIISRYQNMFPNENI